MRAALRVAPLAVRLLRNQQSDQGFELVATLASAIYRACASAKVVARYPVHTIELRTAAHVAASHAAGASASGAAAFVSAGTSAAYAAYAAFYTNAEASAANAANSVAQAVAAASNADAYDPKAAIRAIWEETRVDVALVQDLGVIASSDLPLWSHGAPLWAGLAWSSLQEALPERENWKVWTDWYEDRLNGGSRGEAYELVFASVPIDVGKRAGRQRTPGYWSTCLRTGVKILSNRLRCSHSVLLTGALSWSRSGQSRKMRMRPVIFWKNRAERRPSSESGSPACKQTQGYGALLRFLVSGCPQRSRNSHWPRHLLAALARVGFQGLRQ